MSLFILRVIVPPYCGIPSLSHQFPVAAEVDTMVVDGLGDVTEEWTDDVVVIVVDVIVELGADDVVAVAQDAKISDVAMRQVISRQIAPLFIQTSFIINGILIIY